jgi:hypothetical protein
MPINLDESAIKVFKIIIDDNHDDIITPNEAAQGINQHLLLPISRVFPGIETDSMLNPSNIGEFLNENGTLGEAELKALLEQYFEFLANKTTNPSQNIIVFQNEFNKYRQLQEQQENVIPADEMEIDMEIDEENFNNPHINPDVVNYDFNEEAELERAIELSLENQGVVAAPRNQRNLNEINEIIQVFNVLEPGNESASKFLTEQEKDKPFIIRSQNGNFSGNAIDWPTNNVKEFIECKDDAPSEWQGQNTYRKWKKNNAREFIKVMISGSPTLIIKPDWYDTKLVPGTKYFRLVSAGNVNKFMRKDLWTQKLPINFNPLGTEHCNQRGPVGTYILQEIPLNELNTMIPEGGRKNRKSKSKNLRKIKNKYNKFTRKGTKKNKIIIKTKKINKKIRKSRKLGYRK